MELPFPVPWRRFCFVLFAVAATSEALFLYPGGTGDDLANMDHLLTTREDCDAIAALTRQLYLVGDTIAPPIGRYKGFTPACPWHAYGLIFEPGGAGSPRRVTFSKPKFASGAVSIATSVQLGPARGKGFHCQLIRKGADWKLDKCRLEWVS
jgi:hypothetical protein